MATILLTGSAGFIGFHTVKRLLDDGHTVIGVDNFNDYYDPRIKEERTAMLLKYPQFTLERGDLAELSFVKKVFADHAIDKVCHLAAQAGVRYSLQHPYVYSEVNIVGFLHVLNEAKNVGVKDFIFASSSSVYGEQDKSPFTEDFVTDQPISLYAATKKANELMAYTYHHLYGMNCTGLRFFTVYGPWGRPDMALFSFTKSIIEDVPIQLFNEGHMRRDFTYIDDIVDGVVKSLEHAHPWEIFNLGSHDPVELLYFVECIEKELGKKAIKELLPMQPGDIAETYADTKRAKEKLGWVPKVKVKDGVHEFVSWYKKYHG